MEGNARGSANTTRASVFVYNHAYGVLAGEAGRFSLVGDYTTSIHAPQRPFRVLGRFYNFPCRSTNFVSRKRLHEWTREQFLRCSNASLGEVVKWELSD